MTPTIVNPRRRPSAPVFPVKTNCQAAEKLLRDAAFVLHMTRRVKDAILSGKPFEKPTRS